MLRALGCDTTQPAKPCRDTKRLSHDTKRLSRDTKQPTLSRQRKLYCDKHQFHSEMLMSRHKKSCHDTKVLVAQNLVATQGEPTLSRQRAQGGLLQQPSPSMLARALVLYRARRSAFRVRPAPRSQHHCSVATQNWKWAVAHPFDPLHLFFFAYSKINIKLPYYHKGHWSLENLPKCSYYTKTSLITTLVLYIVQN